MNGPSSRFLSEIEEITMENNAIYRPIKHIFSPPFMWNNDAESEKIE